ncbi:LURP-one-related/scramblase family protein [Halorarum salinum]|uniref:LURP-one-related family protein n=1 Tax=Halorarum salinum TaxID=2743089 RepID=A0A7D5L9F9_9EURY|nr:hypothetical protein [Halobaculum salinum]QLG61192.1 hypothetical protein HUG12_05355 [Halobaculum salinum]
MFDGSRYEVRQKIAIGNKYVVSEGGEEILASAQKKLRLKEDFRFEDVDTGEEAFRVKADSVLDTSAAYDVEDSRSGERVGSVKRSLKSMLKHEYQLLGPDGDVVATVKEDSWARALVRRWVTTLLPFAYVVEAPDGTEVGRIEGAFSLRDRYSVTVSGDVDPRLVVIAAVVVDAIEEN